MPCLPLSTYSRLAQPVQPCSPQYCLARPYPPLVHPPHSSFALPHSLPTSPHPRPVLHALPRSTRPRFDRPTHALLSFTPCLPALLAPSRPGPSSRTLPRSPFPWTAFPSPISLAPSSPSLARPASASPHPPLPRTASLALRRPTSLIPSPASLAPPTPLLAYPILAPPPTSPVMVPPRSRHLANLTPALSHTTSPRLPHTTSHSVRPASLTLPCSPRLYPASLAPPLTSLTTSLTVLAHRPTLPSPHPFPNPTSSTLLSSTSPSFPRHTLLVPYRLAYPVACLAHPPLPSIACPAPHFTLCLPHPCLT